MERAGGGAVVRGGSGWEGDCGDAREEGEGAQAEDEAVAVAVRLERRRIPLVASLVVLCPSRAGNGYSLSL